MKFRPLLPRPEYAARLGLVFPRAAFDPVFASPLAGAGLAALLYLGAVADDESPVPDDAWARPSNVLRMSDAAFARQTDVDRSTYRAAAWSMESLSNLHRSWGADHSPWYADNSRETLRDETFRGWQENGAIRHRSGLPTSSPRPAWVLLAPFADLFDPSLTGAALTDAIDAWRANHTDPGSQIRIRNAREREQRDHMVAVRFPNGDLRHLEPGDASLVLRGVIEEWAPRRLTDPVVLTISEPGDKVHVADQATLTRLGITLDRGSLLPDAVLVDVGTSPVEFWIIEAVHSDGPITEARKARLLEWASDQRIHPTTCRFLSAFVSRDDAAARRRLKDLAADTFAWYADEPGSELAWRTLGDPPVRQT